MKADSSDTRLISDNATFTLSMFETDILPIGNAELKYLDDFSGPAELLYTVMKPCSCIECGKLLNDSGRIIEIAQESFNNKLIKKF